MPKKSVKLDEAGPTRAPAPYFYNYIPVTYSM